MYQFPSTRSSPNFVNLKDNSDELLHEQALTNKKSYEMARSQMKSLVEEVETMA